MKELPATIGSPACRAVALIHPAADRGRRLVFPALATAQSLVRVHGRDRTPMSVGGIVPGDAGPVRPGVQGSLCSLDCQAAIPLIDPVTDEFTREHRSFCGVCWGASANPQAA